MCLLPFFSPPSTFFFSLYLTPLLPSLPPSRSLSVSLVSPSLSELARCANVSTLPFICQSPEQRPAPSVYLCLHSAAPSPLLLSSSPPPLQKIPSILLPLLHPNLPFSSPPSLTLIPPSSSSVAFLSFPPLPSHFHFLHHSCFTHPLTPSLRPSSRSWIMALHWSNIMTFPVLSTTSASSFFGLNPLHHNRRRHHHHHHPALRWCLVLHLF